MRPTPLLRINRLNISFQHEKGWFQAVRDLCLELQAGQTLGIVGESGSGKSVTALAIMHLLKTASVKIVAETMFLGELDLMRLPEKQLQNIRGNRMAMIFQEPMTSLNPVLRCGAQVTEAIHQHTDFSKSEAKKKTLELFKKVLLPRPEQQYSAYPHQLSGGQKQRVMIAMALANNPDLLIADEPTTALDVTVQKEILLLLKQLQKEQGMAMIFISHDLAVISEIADQVLVMHKGEVVEKGAVKQVLNNPQHPYTCGLLACRPPVDRRLKRLPVVREFLENQWPGGLQQMHQELAVADGERKKSHQQMYAQQPVLNVQELCTWFPVSKSWSGKVKNWIKAVDGVSFDVYKGETLGLVGESGCGKTTLGRTLLRLQMPNSGQIFYEGKDVLRLKGNALNDFRKQMQLVFQDPYSSLNPRMRIGDAIIEPMKAHGIISRSSSAKDKAIELLLEVGLEAEHFDRYPHEFSGGQRQRICIARALAVQPEVIICDEPVSALDVSVQAQVLNLLNRLKQQFGLTYIFISHDLSVVKYMSDRVIVMNQGKMEELAEADELFEFPKSYYTKKLISAIPGIPLRNLT